MRLLVPPPRAEVEPLAELPSFSIVIATYEAADTVADAVRSALEQTLPAHEVIVVDDGSRDDVEGALSPFGDAVKTIRQENRGAGAARNTAATAANGEFIAILDADDTYHPRRLEALGELACSRPDLDLITTDARLMVEGEAAGTFATYTPFATENQRTAIFDACFVGGWPAIRLGRFRAIGGFDETLKIAQDWDCWLRAILDGASAGLVAEPYYDYSLHAGSLSSSRAPSLWERAHMLEKARRNPSLRDDERPELERALRMHRSRAAAAEVQAALYRGGSRSRLPHLTVARRLEPRARLAAALAFTAPPLARLLIPEDRPVEQRLAAEAR
jgi:GT2 family glycosyltransferase